MLTGWFRRTWERVFPRGLLRSPLFFLGGLGLLVLVPAAGWYLHLHGKFHTAKSDLGVGEQAAGPETPRPGGADPLVLLRPQTPGGAAPEFLSVTLLPGLGMSVLQLTASVPGRGEIPLLVAPSVQAMADNPTSARVGIMDLRGALEVPWAGSISGLISPLGTSLSTVWKGRTISVERDLQERAGLAEGGMLLSEAADATQADPSTGGATATGSFKATDFAGHWPSKTDVTVTAQLGARTLDLTVTATNVGNEPEPMGIGWQPRFAIPSGDREAVELRLPTGEQMEIADRTRNIPSGRLTIPGETLNRFEEHPSALGAMGLDETLVHLRSGTPDSGAAAEMRDPASGFGLRLVSVSSTIEALHVIAPSGAGYVSLGMQTNFDDATGKEWTGAGIATLAPGESLAWKVRLEIFAVAKR